MQEEDINIKILEEMKQLDYELYCRTGGAFSHLDEDEWDWLIEQFKQLPYSKELLFIEEE